MTPSGQTSGYSGAGACPLHHRTPLLRPSPRCRQHKWTVWKLSHVQSETEHSLGWSRRRSRGGSFLLVHKRQEAKINNPDSILRNISMYKWGFFIDYKHTNIYYKTHLLSTHNWHSPPYSTVDCPDVFMGSLVGWKENSMIDRSQDRGQEYWTRHLFEL